MLQGLVIGKFLPLHAGHLHLIDFALAHCDHLVVLVCSREAEPVPGPQRLAWVQQTLADRPQVQVEYTAEPLPQATFSSRSVSRAWAAYLKTRFPAVGVVFSSEKYGDYLAEYMQIRHMSCDLSRTRVPVSGSLIRRAPHSCWEHLPPVVRTYYRRKICIYGPESTGKSTLTRNLAAHFKTTYVPEVAREILGERHVLYTDIELIARLHARRILDEEMQAGAWLFCDTDLITTRIYAMHYFGRVPDFPAWVQEANSYNLHLFCDIDVPWVADSQRDLGHRREEFRARFLQELKERCLPYVLISGNWEERLQQAVAAVKAVERPAAVGARG